MKTCQYSVGEKLITSIVRTDVKFTGKCRNFNKN